MCLVPGGITRGINGAVAGVAYGPTNIVAIYAGRTHEANRVGRDVLLTNIACPGRFTLLAVAAGRCARGETGNAARLRAKAGCVHKCVSSRFEVVGGE